MEPSLDIIPDVGSYDTGDPNTTNLYLGNLNPKVCLALSSYLFPKIAKLSVLSVADHFYADKIGLELCVSKFLISIS